MLILILVALWVVLLAPAFLKKHLEHRSTVSIDSFHRSLHLLERTGPKLVAPAYRLDSAGDDRRRPGQSGLPAVSSMPGRPNLVLLQPVGDGPAADEDVVDDAAGRPTTSGAAPALRRPGRVDDRLVGGSLQSGVPPTLTERTAAYRAEQARRRRRDVLFALGATATLTGLLGLVHSLRPLWVITVLAVVGLGAYLGLAAYAQALGGARRGSSATSPRYADDVDRRSAAVHGFPGAWDDEPVEHWTTSHSATTAGYPGAWDDDWYDEDSGYEEPRRAAGG